MLEVRGLEAGYGSLQVLRGVSLHVPQGKAYALLGGNGAGKTTTLKAITGLLRPTAGQVLMNGASLEKSSSAEIFNHGIALVPQGRELFPDMSVLENLELGALARKLTVDEIQRGFDEVFLMFPRLKERTRQQAGTLSGGEQQMLAMGRALMSQPQILLMDEPTSGLAPLVVRELAGVIRRLSEAGQTILLVEQNIRMALDVAEQVYLISGGRIAKTAMADELRQDDNLFKAYVG